MYNEQKLKQIQNLVKSATVLNEQEKIEWMALIELMNDKQINELEEILKQPPVTPAQPVVPVLPVQPQPPQPQSQQRPQIGIPIEAMNTSSLSHISNLPSQFSSQPATQPAAPEPVPEPIPEPSPLPPPQPAPPPVPTPMPSPTPQLVEPVPMPETTPMPPIEPMPMPGVDPNSGTGAVYIPVLKLESFEDIAKITAGALHQQNREVFHKTINDLASQYGYFQVITSLEQSPLYKDYIGYGRSVLSGQKEDLPLSQEEFEFITDVLLSLKVNRF